VLLFYHHVDLNDYENPIKMLLDDSLYIPLETERRTEVNVFLEPSELRSRDSRYQLEIFDDVHPFVEVGKVETKTKNQNLESPEWDNRQVRVFFRMNSKRTVYVRNVSTIYDTLGEVGGLLSIVYSLSLVITRYYAVE